MVVQALKINESQAQLLEYLSVVMTLIMEPSILAVTWVGQVQVRLAPPIQTISQMQIMIFGILGQGLVSLVTLFYQPFQQLMLVGISVNSDLTLVKIPALLG